MNEILDQPVQAPGKTRPAKAVTVAATSINQFPSVSLMMDAIVRWLLVVARYGLSFCRHARLVSPHADESSSESECESDGGSSCSSSSDSEVFDVIAEIKRKKAHPDRLHDELWYNDPGQVGAQTT